MLAHVGSELRVYGEGLKIHDRVSIDGPLAFVRVTPDGNFVAIGVIRERHTPELHAQLSESLGSDPERRCRYRSSEPQFRIHRQIRVPVSPDAADVA